MALDTTNPSGTQAWQELREHFFDMQSVSIKDMFSQDASRAAKFTIKWNDFLVDYSKNFIDYKTMRLLLSLAEEMQLKDAISKYFNGEIINQTERRAVLHTALRANESVEVKVDGKNVMPEIISVKSKMKSFSDEIISGTRKGFSGKPFT